MPSTFKGCVICSGKRGQPRNGQGGQTCSASQCKGAYKGQRALQPSAGVVVDVEAADKMPSGMWVHEIEEILGEKCCDPRKLSKKKRKGGPGSDYHQQFLVRGTFLEDDGGEDSDEDDTPEPNTLWVDQADLLETIAMEDVKRALKARCQAVLCGL